MNIRKSITSLVLIALIGCAAWLGIKWLEANKNTAEEIPPVVTVPKVEVLTAELSDYQVKVKSNGVVMPAKQSQLSAEVAGLIIRVSDQLKVGNVVKKGDFIAEINGADYESAVASAEATVTDANLLIIQETARSEMNIREWKKLAKGEPTDLVTRRPHLASARAKLLSAEAAVAKANRDLQRTQIIAPYEMKVERKFVEVGNYIVPGGRVADVHSAGELEVRLPLTMEDYLLVQDPSALIELVAQLGNQKLTWQGKYLRDEGVVDQQTLSLPILAKVLPNASQGRFKFPPVGLYLKASIDAQKLLQKVVIPRDTVKLGDMVLLVDEEGKLRRRKVNVLFTDREVAVVEGVNPGEQIISSPMESPIEGMKVEVVDLDAQMSNEREQK